MALLGEEETARVLRGFTAKSFQTQRQAASALHRRPGEGGLVNPKKGLKRFSVSGMAGSEDEEPGDENLRGQDAQLGEDEGRAVVGFLEFVDLVAMFGLEWRLTREVARAHQDMHVGPADHL